MKRAIATICSICVVVVLVGAEAPKAFDDFVAYTQRDHLWENGLRQRFPMPEDGRMETALEIYFLEIQLSTNGSARFQLREIWNGPTPWDSDREKIALALVDTERGKMVFVVWRSAERWAMRPYSIEGLKERRAEPGATDNPGDAQ